MLFVDVVWHSSDEDFCRSRLKSSITFFNGLSKTHISITFASLQDFFPHSQPYVHMLRALLFHIHISISYILFSTALWMLLISETSLTDLLLQLLEVVLIPLSLSKLFYINYTALFHFSDDNPLMHLVEEYVDDLILTWRVYIFSLCITDGYSLGKW